MTEKLQPPSTLTAIPNQRLPPLNPSSPAPFPTVPSPASVLLPTSSAIPAAAEASAATAVAFAPSVQDGPIPKVEEAAEEEPYTIKCICGFTGDDGATIYCEICDSWQHIECFYPNNGGEVDREEFAHACHECKPRALNVAHAVEYQRQRLQAAAAAPAVNPPKPKRPPSKSHGQSHKKKAKPSDILINGHGSPLLDPPKHPALAQDVNSPHPHPPSKKLKSSHKPSQSIGGSHTKRSPSYSASRTAVQQGHPLSPATTPPDLPEIHNYSTDFLSRCNDQESVPNVQTNSFASLGVSNTTSIWLREHERMLRETGHEFADVFQVLPPDFDLAKRSARVESTKRILSPDAVVRWRYLATSEAVDKDVPLMELNGQIGFQKDYCIIPANRYDELSSPLPFVFFHPQLPLYIDTRREGSLARYVRRSCRPNAVLDTFLSGASEYHFWLVSDRRIAADEQITIPWDFRLAHDLKGRWLRLLGLGDDDANANDDIDVEEEEYNTIARWVYLILSEYGGCACDLGNECAFARFHRIYGTKVHQARSNHNGTNSNATKKKSSRKTKSHALSPTSNSHATNSRAPSEGHLDEFTENDKLSTSSRSKPPSRDMTPAPRQGSFDTLGILTEPTDRDKRKVAMVEDSFRRLEQQPPRKKKRVSDGPTTAEKSISTPGKLKPKNSSIVNGSERGPNGTGERPEVVNGTTGHLYVDASTSRSKSGSPVSAVSPQTAGSTHNHGFPSLAAGLRSTFAVSRQTSAGPSASYCDAGTQTDPTEGEWYSVKPPTPRLKRRVVSLSKRLLNCRRRGRLEDSDGKGQHILPPSASSAMEIDAPSAEQLPNHEEKTSTEAPVSDVHMADASVSTAIATESASDSKSRSVPTPIEASTQATSIQADLSAASHSSALGFPIKKSPDLHVQMPKVPSFSDVVAPTVASTPTPLSASSIVQSPFAMTSANPFGSPVATPSPVKKKMSLSDYTKSRKAAAGRPSVGTILKPSAPNADEPTSATSTDGTGAGDSPTGTEKAHDGTSSAISTAATTG